MNLDQEKLRRIPEKNKKEAQRIFISLQRRLKEIFARANAIRLQDIRQRLK